MEFPPQPNRCITLTCIATLKFTVGMTLFIVPNWNTRLVFVHSYVPRSLYSQVVIQSWLFFFLTTITPFFVTEKTTKGVISIANWPSPRNDSQWEKCAEYHNTVSTYSLYFLYLKINLVVSNELFYCQLNHPFEVVKICCICLLFIVSDIKTL